MAEQIRAELVANVLSVLVSAGDTVSAGQPVVIMESMKMEIPVLAPVDGKVEKILVAEGQAVTEGIPLVAISH